MGKRVLTRQELFELGDLIRERCHKDERGFAVYDMGWSDHKIFDHFDCPNKTVAHVTHLRSQLVGNLKITATGGVGFGVYTKRIGELESRLESLEKWAAGRKMVPYNYGEE